MPKTKKWSKERCKAFEEKQAAKRNPNPPSPPEEATNLFAPQPSSPFLQLSNSLFKFHDELQAKLHALAMLFRY